MTEELTHREKYNQTKEDNPKAKREIYELVLKGYTHSEISPIINKKYDCDRKTVWRWIRDTYKRIGDVQKDNEEQYGINLGLAVERLLNVHQKALENGKEQTALQCLRMVAELQGLTEPQRVRSSGKSKDDEDNTEDNSDVDVSDLSDEELKKLLEG